MRLFLFIDTISTKEYKNTQILTLTIINITNNSKDKLKINNTLVIYCRSGSNVSPESVSIIF